MKLLAKKIDLYQKKSSMTKLNLIQVSFSLLQTMKVVTTMKVLNGLKRSKALFVVVKTATVIQKILNITNGLV